MTKHELIQKLKEMRSTAKPREVSATTVLFGILFDDDIARAGTNAAQISKDAGLAGWDVEINYGRKLAQYVTVEPEIEDRWRHCGG